MTQLETVTVTIQIFSSSSTEIHHYISHYVYFHVITSNTAFFLSLYLLLCAVGCSCCHLLYSGCKQAFTHQPDTEDSFQKC